MTLFEFLFVLLKDPSVVAIDGTFRTASNQALVNLLKDKTSKIKANPSPVPFLFQEHQFPAKFADIPPIIVMEAASRISTEAAAGGGGGAENQDEQFNHWIKMIKSFGSTRGKKALTFEQQLPSKDVRLGID